MSEVTAKRFIVSGRVQGVGFRAATADEAIRIGLTGWVRNLTDGRVESQVQGTNDRIEDFARWMERGPRWARVSEVNVYESDVDPTIRGFGIRW